MLNLMRLMSHLTIQPDNYSTQYTRTQELKAFEGSIVAKIGDIVTAILFVKKLEQIPSLLQSLFARVENEGGKAIAKSFRYVGPISLGSLGVHVSVRIPLRSDKHKYILAEIKIFADEVEGAQKNRAINKWIQTATKMDKQIILATNESGDESYPWINSAASLAELNDNVVEITPYFKKLCSEIAAEMNCAACFGSENQEVATRRASLVDKLGNTQDLKTASIPSWKILLTVFGVASIFGLVWINRQQIGEPILVKNAIINEPAITESSPIKRCCECDPMTEYDPIAPVVLNTSTNITVLNTSTNATAIEPGKPEIAPPREPCQRNISYYRVELSEWCSEEERKVAYEEQQNLFIAREKELNENAINAVAEKSKIIQGEIDALKVEKEEWSKSWEERIRKIINPTPEELAELYAEIDCELDERFKGWPDYTPHCKARSAPEIALTVDCDSLKSQHRKLSLLYHPDKNKSPEAQDKFLEITNTYEKLCPPKTQEPYEPVESV